MTNNNAQEKMKNIICSLLVVLGVYIVAANLFDFFYDLNDDLVIKDILSGAYSGRPEGHTNQILFPLGFVLAFVYKLLPAAPVFGIFLCACFMLCLAMIVYRMAGFFKNNKIKIFLFIFMTLLFLSLMLWEMIFVQYSVVCGLLVGTACFWFYTSPTQSDATEFWLKNMPALFLVYLAFLVRSEMMLLTSPFLATVGLLHWMESTKAEEESYTGIELKKKWQHFLSKRNITKYILFLLLLGVGLGLLAGGDYLAFREKEWKEYRDFFDARTTVYDFTWYPSYEDAQEFYETEGISEIRYRLIDNYNFGLDESITAHTLDTIASYNEKGRFLGSVSIRLKNTIAELVKRSVLPQDAPYNYFVLLGYIMVIGLAVVQKERKYLWRLVLLFIMRNIPWFYLIYVQRAVTRITHPLYMIEFLILSAMLVRELYDRPLWNVEKYYRMVVAGVFAVLALISLPCEIKEVKAEQSKRTQSMENQKQLEYFAKENPENYYYIDVYSTVDFVEKMFDGVDNSVKNYDLLGGWYCNSPIQRKNIQKYSGATTVEEALLLENIYFVAKADADITFVQDYYASKDKKVELELRETIGNEENPFQVYKIVEKTKSKKRTPKK